MINSSGGRQTVEREGRSQRKVKGVVETGLSAYGRGSEGVLERAVRTYRGVDGRRRERISLFWMSSIGFTSSLAIGG